MLSKVFRSSPAEGSRMPRDLQDDRPPILSSWTRLYAAIVAYLFFLIGLFYAFTRAYRISP